MISKRKYQKHMSQREEPKRASLRNIPNYSIVQEITRMVTERNLKQFISGEGQEEKGVTESKMAG